MAFSRLVGVIGSRSLPVRFAPLVSSVVSLFLSRGFGVASGGAMGADSFALSALLSSGSSSHGVLYSAWVSASGFPSSVRPDVERFIGAGGSVVWGSAASGCAHPVAVSALLRRNRHLVSASSVIVAFLHGPSHGSLYTVRQAVSRGVPVIVFLCGGASLPPDLARHCYVFHKEVI
jgi:predicted Rossmann fold nucleotide-binding protein DprA/Smf involved in DNA uptake